MDSLIDPHRRDGAMRALGRREDSPLLPAPKSTRSEKLPTNVNGNAVNTARPYELDIG